MMKEMKKAAAVFLAAFLAAGLLSSCGGKDASGVGKTGAEEIVKINFPTAGASGALYAVGAAVTHMWTNCVQGVQAKREELEGYISKYSVGWSLGRIARMAVAIMEVCMYEALYIDDAPVSAAINEAVELTRKYENEDVVSFVNGILGGFARQMEQPC